jgi:hypothetical protein
MPMDWEEGPVRLAVAELSHEPVGKGAFMPLPVHMAQATHYGLWTKSFAEYLFRNARLMLWYSPALKLYGQAGESRRDFRVRCEKAVRSRLSVEAAKARAGVENKMRRLQEQLRREQRELVEDQAEVEARKREELLSYGESAINLLSGRRPSYMISHVSRQRRMMQQAQADVEESVEAIKDMEGQLGTLAAAWEEQAQGINERWAAALERIEQIEVAPRRADVAVEFCGLAWVPVWEIETGEGQPLLLPAFEPRVDSE